MSISDKLGQLNAERFRTWHTPFTPDNARQAILAFKGDVYTGLDAESFSEDDFAFAQQHLRMLSGLYGLLKPLDLMQDRKSTRLNSSHVRISYAVFCLKKK